MYWAIQKSVWCNEKNLFIPTEKFGEFDHDDEAYREAGELTDVEDRRLHSITINGFNSLNPIRYQPIQIIEGIDDMDEAYGW